MFTSYDMMLIWLLSVLMMLAEAQVTPPPRTTPRWKLPPDGWDRTDDLPNPQTDYGLCQQHERSWLCDPNKMLTDTQSEEVRSKLNEVHKIGENQPVCQCEGGCVPAGVAIINRLKLLSGDVLQHILADHASKTLRTWNYVNPKCETSFLVFMSWKQNQTRVVVWPEMKLNLTESCEARVNYTKEHCQEDKTRCILDLLDTYRSIVLSKPCESSGGATLPVELIVVIVLSIILFIAIVVAILCFVKVRLAKKKGHSSATRQEQTALQTA